MKKLVILGGGFAGAKIAKALENYYHVTLIDSKNYYEFTPGILRSIVKTKHLRKIQVLHRHYLHKAKVLNENILSISNKQIITNKRKLKFDYLVICLGSSYNIPFKEKDIIIATRGKNLKEHYKKLCKAKKITIIGGGIVGVELAAEISEFYKDKEITIIHSKNKLMERNSIKAINYAEKFLKTRGIKIIYNERAVSYVKKTVLTDKGTKVKSDMVFICTGIKPNYEPLEKNFKKFLNEKNQIIVNEYLQVNGYKNIFAAGDITAIKEEKLAQNAEIHADIVIKNLKNIDKNWPSIKYNSKPRIMVISLGRFNGILQYGNFVLTGLIPGILKTLIEWKTMIRYKIYPII
ncbi:MAG: FAD-dependent oxidoreductase [Candidatus Pacearchaeota archaeon]